jgi:hypothetical protein
MTKPERISYSVDEAAAAVGLSANVIRGAIRNGDLLAHYPGGGGKALILHVDLVAWVAGAPTERRTA